MRLQGLNLAFCSPIVVLILYLRKHPYTNLMLAEIDMSNILVPIESGDFNAMSPVCVPD